MCSVHLFCAHYNSSRPWHSDDNIAKAVLITCILLNFKLEPDCDWILRWDHAIYTTFLQYWQKRFKAIIIDSFKTQQFSSHSYTVCCSRVKTITPLVSHLCTHRWERWVYMPIIKDYLAFCQVSVWFGAGEVRVSWVWRVALQVSRAISQHPHTPRQILCDNNNQKHQVIARFSQSQTFSLNGETLYVWSQNTYPKPL